MSNSMIETVTHLDLPVGGSGCGDIRMAADSTEVLVEYEFRHEGQDWIGTIRFDDVVAHRFRDEMHSRGYAQDSYDTVVEVLESEWRNATVQDEPGEISSSARTKRHFAVLLSNNGYLEVIADSCNELPRRPGLLTTDE